MSKRLPHGLLGFIDTSCRLHGQAAIGSNLNIRRISGHVEIDESSSVATTHRRCAGQRRERRCSVKADGERGEDHQKEWENPSI